MPAAEFRQPPHLAPELRRATFLRERVIVPVHRQQQIVSLEVFIG